MKTGVSRTMALPPILPLRRIPTLFTAYQAVNMEYIHQRPGWPDFRWNYDAFARRLAEVRYRQGLLLGRMKNLGFDLRSEAALTTVTSDVIASSAIEGESLDPVQVRSSVARHLGLETGGQVLPGRGVEGIVEVMTDANGAIVNLSPRPDSLTGTPPSFLPVAAECTGSP